MNINLEYYRIFYYVGKLGGISLAADALALSQPAVSQAIKQLENNLGNKLFIRTPRGVRLTTEGEVLYLYIKQGYEYMMVGEEKMKDIQNLESGEIRIGASDMTLQFYLLPFLEAFHERYPKVKFHITNAPTPTTLKYIQEGFIDFGVVSTPMEERNGMDITPVREIEDVFVAGDKFEHLKGRDLDFKVLEGLPVICLEGNTSSRSHINDTLEKNQVILNPEFELATSDMLVQFALRNLGVAAVMKDFALKYLESGELFELKFNKSIPKRHFCVITNERVPVSTAARRLLESML